MPPFRLELPDKRKKDENFRIMYAKNTYERRVHMSDWEKHQEGLPIDVDPYCPGGVNYFLSHYKSFGFGPVEPFETTTQAMLQQVHLKENLTNPHTYLLNYFTYKDTEACESKEVKDKNCPPICADDYLTTMQRSYTPPHPYRMQRFGFPKIPFQRYRKFKDEDPELSEYTFYDEGFNTRSALLRKHKHQRWVSYIPWLEVNSDGGTPEGREQKIYELDYLKERL